MDFLMLIIQKNEQKSQIVQTLYFSVVTLPKKSRETATVTLLYEAIFAIAPRMKIQRYLIRHGNFPFFQNGNSTD